jgi:hypothetical protein
VNFQSSGLGLSTPGRGFLDRNHSVANPGFSRWLVLPAALSIHLAIGQVYAFSVFKKPLNYLVQVSTYIRSGSATLARKLPVFLTCLLAEPKIVSKWRTHHY